MIENKLDELFQAIKESSEYKAYCNIGEVLDRDEEIKELIADIKKLQQKSVKLEEAGDNSYLEVDKKINDKVKRLNDKPVYQEYLRRMDELNDVLSESSNQIESYINSKI